MKNYIIIDKIVARSFIHQANHLNCDFVDPVCRGIKLKMNGLKDMSVGEIVDNARERVESLSGYIKLALESSTQPQDTEKLVKMPPNSSRKAVIVDKDKYAKLQQRIEELESIIEEMSSLLKLQEDSGRPVISGNVRARAEQALKDNE